MACLKIVAQSLAQLVRKKHPIRTTFGTFFWVSHALLHAFRLKLRIKSLHANTSVAIGTLVTSVGAHFFLQFLEGTLQ